MPEIKPSKPFRPRRPKAQRKPGTAVLPYSDPAPHHRVRTDGERRALFLERYAGRHPVEGNIKSVLRGLGLRWSTVDSWLRDPDFAAAVEEIDRRRIEVAVRFASDLWPRILSEQASIAAGLPEPVPDVTRRRPEEIPFLVAAYRARAARRLQMSTRAAEFVADVLGLRRSRAGLVVHADAEGTTVELFGTLPSSEEELLAENERLDAIFERARERAAALAAEGGEDPGRPAS